MYLQAHTNAAPRRNIHPNDPQGLAKGMESAFVRLVPVPRLRSPSPPALQVDLPRLGPSQAATDQDLRQGHACLDGPPVGVCCGGEDYCLWDGSHHLHACRTRRIPAPRLGRAAIPADPEQMGKRIRGVAIVGHRMVLPENRGCAPPGRRSSRYQAAWPGPCASSACMCY